MRLAKGKQPNEVPFLIAKLQAVVLPVYGWWGDAMGTFEAPWGAMPVSAPQCNPLVYEWV